MFLRLRNQLKQKEEQIVLIEQQHAHQVTRLHIWTDALNLFRNMHLPFP